MTAGEMIELLPQRKYGSPYAPKPRRTGAWLHIQDGLWIYTAKPEEYRIDSKDIAPPHIKAHKIGSLK